MPKHGVAFGETLRYINFIRGLHCKGCSEHKEGKICKSETDCLKKDILCLIDNGHRYLFALQFLLDLFFHDI